MGDRDRRLPESPTLSGSQLWQWWRQARTDAIAAEISPIELDRLLEAFSDLERLDLRWESFRDRPQIALKRPWPEIVELWDRRLKERVPLQYLLGTAHWRHFSLTVAPGVLIPRPETELIVDLARGAVEEIGKNLAEGDWADLGTGSGAIALGLAEVFPKATIHAVDRSHQALAIARHNAKISGWEHRIRFYQGSWWTPLTFLKGEVCGVVSNPPYIPSEEVLNLQPEVTRHEPHEALDGGSDGLDCIRHLAAASPDYLRSGGIFIVEMMAGQGEAVAEILRSQGNYHSIQIVPDLAGLDRFAIAHRK
ncbi:peptide chain release factor N(5)-glutamine methyltransferase [Lyngbya sp. CCY1209]|uniref:peptide chain release factor N(5)-glutamine methyltransferase n=1 Tax=Lyngbya sp. CCY1209 TaxID=2886103 RepID=UPI002D210CA0|nr:peptide chain release factor N(5)-glutamine methyltransferase [Lyngbya sp. CCY1209]MEB3884563.1 peptide chain release factor N(5)-glutamine methyltransferase [Lyngbya sp. CCY1209]